MTEYQTPRLPRLLDRERVEVRLGINGTHVFEETGIDRLLSHLTEAKRLFRPDYDPATGASYESLVKELHLTRLAVDEAAKSGFERGVLAAIGAAEDIPTSVSVHVTAHDASIATRCKEAIVMAIGATCKYEP